LPLTRKHEKSVDTNLQIWLSNAVNGAIIAFVADIFVGVQSLEGDWVLPTRELSIDYVP
jgi:hypothetical protein